MGARLVAASLPIYALAVALSLFLVRQVQENSWFWPMWYGGLVAVAALALLLAGGAAARAFDRGCVTIVGSVFLLVVVLVVGLAFAGQPTPLWVVVYVAPLLAVGFFIAYAVSYRTLSADEPAVASDALSAAAPFVIAALLGPIVLGPRYFPDSTSERIAAVIATTAIVAVGGALALIAGASALRLSPRTTRIALTVLAVFGLVVFARGLPNPPMAFASAPPLTLEYPADRADLAADAATYGARLALVVRRTGVVLPAQGVHVRYRWDNGPDDPAPPKGAVVVTLPAELMDRPTRADRFAERIATTLVPQPDWRVHEAYSPWSGFVTWASTLPGPDADAEVAKLCDLIVNKKYAADFRSAPYVRAERDGGVEAAQSLYARWMQSPPTFADWNAQITSSCLSLLRPR